MITPKKFQTKVLSWYAKEGRHDLPWQKKQTPYRVWVSEIMLQQTQANTVISYFKKFITRFPSVKKLALANEDEIFHYWSGLGFYARARNLHKTAKIIHHEFRGQFPNSVEELMTLPGIGRSTAGAIISLAKNLRAPILDGNVKRVLARAFMLTGYPEETQTQKKFWQLAETLVPKEQCRDYTQAMMDLGALICTPANPRCNKCPLLKNCLAYENNKVLTFPYKKPKLKIPKKEIYFLIFQNEHNEILLEKRPAIGIWGGLWGFPECHLATEIPITSNERYHIHINRTKPLKSFKHIFTHFELTIHPVLISTTSKQQVIMESCQQIWYNTDHALPGGIPKPVHKILKHLLGPLDD